MKLRLGFVWVACVATAMAAWGQTPVSSSPSISVPPIIQFSNVATDLSGYPLSGTVSITFSLYSNSQGGAALWSETQNVQLDTAGHYSVYLGLTQTNGLPANLFTGLEARWLGVKIAGQAEQPRIYLVSVPYAMKAGDAATVGGLPPSAFVLATPSGSATNTTSTDAPSSGSTQSSAPPPNGAITGAGTVDYIPLWDTTSDIISSVLYQSGTGTTAKIGINTKTPASALDIQGGATVRGTLSLPSAGAATSSAGKNSQAQTLAASAFNSSTSKPVNQLFQWQAEPAGNDTASPSGTLNLLFGSGTTKAAETGLHIASNSHKMQNWSRRLMETSTAPLNSEARTPTAPSSESRLVVRSPRFTVSALRPVVVMAGSRLQAWCRPLTETSMEPLMAVESPMAAEPSSASP